MKTVRICVVGTNFISDLFCEAAACVQGVEVSAVYSRGLDTGSAFAEKHSIKNVFSSYDEMLSSDKVDAVYVASPTFLHCEHTVRALEAGKHVLCEKSTATSYGEFILMRDAALRAERVFLEAMRPAHDPCFAAIRSALHKIGKITSATLEFKKYSSRYDKFKQGIIENAFDPNLKNSALSDIGVYPMWLAVALFGMPDSVSSFSKRLHNGFDADGAVTLTYGKDLTVRVLYSKIVGSDVPSVIRGEQGWLLIDKISEPKQLTLVDADGAETIAYQGSIENNMVYEISDFRDMILGRMDFKHYLDVSEMLAYVMDWTQRVAIVEE